MLEVNFGKRKRILKICGFTLIDTKQINHGLLAGLQKYTSINSPWKHVWAPYFSSNDIKELICELSKNMDKTSLDYIDRIVTLYSSIFNGTDIHEHLLITKDYAWTDEDRRMEPEFNKFQNTQWKGIQKKYDGLETFDPYLFFNCVGLREISNDIHTRVADGCVLDCGAYIGDSACMLYEQFSPKKIVAFEPDNAAKDKLDSFISRNALDDKIKTVKCGLSDKPEHLPLFKTQDSADAGASFSKIFDHQSSYEEPIELTTIDEHVASEDLKVSLIKMDIEGFEKNAILGALDTIQKQKPILVISIYHSPVDFFEIKPMLEKLNLGYKFMIRRAEAILPLADIVLIAY